MRHEVKRPLALAVCALLCSLTALSVWHTAAGRAEDRNADGRPDLWRSIDGQGRVALALDSNDDGRSDIQEIYEDGALIRREADRDFDDRIDFIETFDPATRLVVQSLSDVNGDGVADLLVLYQEGEPVYSKWQLDSVAAADAVTLQRQRAGGRTGNSPLLPLEDPFSADLAIKTTRTPVGGPEAAASAPVGIVEQPGASSPLPEISQNAFPLVTALHAVHVSRFSPRAPPVRT